MNHLQLIALLRVAESALWEAATVSPGAQAAHQQIVRGLRAVESAENCRQCGNPLSQRGAGRPKTYCGPTCRSAAYRGRQHS